MKTVVITGSSKGIGLSLATEFLKRECSVLFRLCDNSDIFIACAAVADYRPADIQAQKIKKGPEHISLDMVRNPDIVAAIASSKPGPFTVGFAAETNDVVSYAREKMQRKGLDMIVSNDVSKKSIGFNSDENEVTVIWPGGEQILAQSAKANIARQIIALIADQLDTNPNENQEK